MQLMRAGTQQRNSVQQRKKQDKNSAVERKIQDQPQKHMTMLQRRIHGGSNETGVEASSDEEEEGSEDADHNGDQQPAPSSVINISAHNKKNHFLFHWTQELQAVWLQLKQSREQE